MFNLDNITHEFEGVKDKINKNSDKQMLIQILDFLNDAVHLTEEICKQQIRKLIVLLRLVQQKKLSGKEFNPRYDLKAYTSLVEKTDSFNSKEYEKIDYARNILLKMESISEAYAQEIQPIVEKFSKDGLKWKSNLESLIVQRGRMINYLVLYKEVDLGIEQNKSNKEVQRLILNKINYLELGVEKLRKIRNELFVVSGEIGLSYLITFDRPQNIFHTPEKLKSKLKLLVSKGRIKKVLDILLHYKNPNSPFDLEDAIEHNLFNDNEIILLYNRFSRLEESKRQNTGDNDKEYNKLILNILEYIDEVLD